MRRSALNEIGPHPPASAPLPNACGSLSLSLSLLCSRDWLWFDAGEGGPQHHFNGVGVNISLRSVKRGQRPRMTKPRVASAACPQKAMPRAFLYVRHAGRIADLKPSHTIRPWRSGCRGCWHRVPRFWGRPPSRPFWVGVGTPQGGSILEIRATECFKSCPWSTSLPLGRVHFRNSRHRTSQIMSLLKIASFGQGPF